MTVLTDRVKAALDNLKGSAFTNARALEIVEAYTDSADGTTDDKAILFLDELTAHVKKKVRQNVLMQTKRANDAGEQTAADDAVTDL